MSTKLSDDTCLEILSFFKSSQIDHMKGINSNIRNLINSKFSKKPNFIFGPTYLSIFNNSFQMNPTFDEKELMESQEANDLTEMFPSKAIINEESEQPAEKHKLDILTYGLDHVIDKKIDTKVMLRFQNPRLKFRKCLIYFAFPSSNQERMREVMGLLAKLKYLWAGAELHIFKAHPEFFFTPQIYKQCFLSFGSKAIYISFSGRRISPMVKEDFEALKKINKSIIPSYLHANCSTSMNLTRRVYFYFPNKNLKIPLDKRFFEDSTPVKYEISFYAPIVPLLNRFRPTLDEYKHRKNASF